MPIISDVSIVLMGNEHLEEQSTSEKNAGANRTY